MRRIGVFLSNNDCVRPCPWFAGLDTLVPRVAKFCVTYTSTVSEPRTSATATTAFAGFPDAAASGTYGTDGRRRRFDWCFYVALVKTKKKDKGFFNDHYLA